MTELFVKLLHFLQNYKKFTSPQIAFYLTSKYRNAISLCIDSSFNRELSDNFQLNVHDLHISIHQFIRHYESLL